MIKWSEKNKLSTELVKTIEEKVREVELIDNYEEEVKSLGEGSFAIVFDADKAVIKMDNYNGDYIDDILFDCEIKVYYDASVLEKLQHLSCIPRFYGEHVGQYSNHYTIMEKIEGISLENFLVNNGGNLDEQLSNEILVYITSIINSGWYPHDTRFSDIIITDNGIKFLDFNLYQNIEYLKVEGCWDSSKANEEYAIEFWDELKRWGLIWVNDRIKFTA